MLEDDENYVRIYEDFNDISETNFFKLGNELEKPPRLRLGKRKKHHRWGIFYILFKRKTLLRLRGGEIRRWDALKWRPVAPYSGNVWSKWYSMTGKTLSLLAKVIFDKGDSVRSQAEIQSRLIRHNHRFGIDGTQK